MQVVVVAGARPWSNDQQGLLGGPLPTALLCSALARVASLRHVGRTQTRNDKPRSGLEENELQAWSRLLVHISDIIK